MIQSIEGTQAKYKQLSKQVNHLTEKIDKSKKELNEFIRQFDTFVNDEIKFEKIKQSVAVLTDLKEIIDDYNDEHVGNREYSFGFNEIQIKDIFGCFVEKRANIFEYLTYVYFANSIHSQ